MKDILYEVVLKSPPKFINYLQENDYDIIFKLKKDSDIIQLYDTNPYFGYSILNYFKSYIFYIEPLNKKKLLNVIYHEIGHFFELYGILNNLPISKFNEIFLEEGPVNYHVDRYYNTCYKNIAFSEEVAECYRIWIENDIKDQIKILKPKTYKIFNEIFCNAYTN